MRTLIMLLALAVVGLAAACTTVTPPVGYARMEEAGWYDVKAVSTDGAVFTLKQFDNDDEENGTLAYWVEAVKKQMTAGRGYTLKEEGEFTCGLGKGRWLLLTIKHQGIDYLYLLGLVVDGDDIYVMESAGDAATFEKDLEPIRKAFGTLE